MDPIRESYDRVARAYAERLAGELAHKPWDRAVLDGFAARNAGRGLVGDIGCGPGHVGAYIAARGAEVVGIDLSAGQIAEARRLHPGLAFEEGDMLRLGDRPRRFAALVAFYALVHLPPGALGAALRQFHAALRPGGEVLLALHLGGEALRVQALWDQPVDLTFHLFAEEDVVGAAAASGLREVWREARDPYPDVEYPSRRLYLRAVRPA
ncbi:MAG TPA: class I SAM-dependent methyltransferase [Acetobacteraceae bacterium]|nr:class I SAM-dependent methyltransferase [Acetobacteraceae bacterium]